MSFCKEEGKDRIIFVTKEDAQKESKVALSEDEEELEGAIRKDGSINWECPCLGSVVSGPCAYEFREFLSCVVSNSKEEPKVSDCYEKIVKFTECENKHPNLYGSDDTNDTDDTDEIDFDTLKQQGNDETDSKSDSSKTENVEKVTKQS